MKKISLKTGFGKYTLALIFSRNFIGKGEERGE